MLAVISDLHLHDGSFGSIPGNGAFHLFAERLADMARRASWRADGQYRPIDRIDLLLLGDILDIIRSRKWLTSNVRPWSDLQDRATSQVVGDIVQDILTLNADSLRILRALASEGAIQIPTAMSDQFTLASNSLTRIPVRIHYMVGNHDWFLHVRGAAYDMIRQRVAHYMGLANIHTEPFPHDPQESNELQQTLRAHRVLARHGDIYDPINFAEDRDLASLGDAIVIELMLKFIHQLQTNLGNDLPESFQIALFEMDKVRPLVAIPIWLDGILERTCTSPALRKKIKTVWDSLADDFLSLPVVRQKDTISPFDLVDGLERTLKFSKRLSIGWASRMSEWLLALRGAKSNSYSNHAIAETDFRNRRARSVVYGHTHQFESTPLDASHADSFVLNQVYFNSGTWQRVYQSTLNSVSEHEFIPHDSLSFISFYQQDERSGRPFESWTGHLGISPTEVQALSKRKAAEASGTRIHQASFGAPIARPHFQAQPISERIG